MQLVIRCRLAQLSQPTRKILARAATIGRSFSFELLEASSGVDSDSLLDCLEEAEELGLILSGAERPETQFEFVHELIRQVVLTSLSVARRRQLHLEVADAIERIYPSELEERASELAHHYSHSANTEKAIKYLHRVVQQFSVRGSFAEAVAQFETGLELLKKLPDDDRRAELELDLRSAAGTALMAIKGWGSLETEQLSARAMVLCRRPGIN